MQRSVAIILEKIIVAIFYSIISIIYSSNVCQKDSFSAPKIHACLSPFYKQNNKKTFKPKHASLFDKYYQRLSTIFHPESEFYGCYLRFYSKILSDCYNFLLLFYQKLGEHRNQLINN